MSEQKQQYFENVENESHREYIENHNHCILCHSALELQHIRLLEVGNIKEEAFCPKCDMRTRAKVYTLH